MISRSNSPRSITYASLVPISLIPLLTAPLNPSTAEGRLEWETKYKVTNVDWLLPDGQTTEEVRLSTTITFTTPQEPPRIKACTDRQLNDERKRMTLSFEGRSLGLRTSKVRLTNGSADWNSLSKSIIVDNTHCTAEFAVGEEETISQLRYGEEYTLKGNFVSWTGFLVEDGITIRVPFPPKITKMVFLSSNSLHTGCVVTLTGTNLIVGNSLNVSLEDSLAFFTTITSSTEAQSPELPIGWPTTLQHNTKYTIATIEPTDAGDGKTLFDPAISNTTDSLPTSVVIYVDSGPSSDSSLFCGDFNRPCSSIEFGWKIVEVFGFSSLSISILHNTTQKEQIKIMSQHEVVIESGPSTKPELFVSPSLSSSSLEGEGMVDVSGGRLWIHQVDVALSDSPSLIFIRMVGGQLTLESCSLTSTSSTHNSNPAASLCSWSEGAIVLDHAKTTITSSSFSELSSGAINMKGGNLTIEGGIFHDNNPHISSLPSLRHNIHCSGEGELKIGSLSGGDGIETQSAWISESDCSLTAKEEISRSPYFVPSLSSSSTSKLNKTEQAFLVTIEGTTLIPCSLMLEVFEKKKDGSEGLLKQFQLSQNTTTSFKDTAIVFLLPLSSLSSFNDSLEWRGRLAFGHNEITATSFVIQKSAAERRAQAVKDNMKWWLPLVISLSLLLVIVLVFVLVCWRRRRVQKNGPKDGEMKESDQPQMDDEKVDIVTDNIIGVNSIQTFSTESGQETNRQPESESSDGMFNCGNLVEVLPCGGDMKNTVFVSKDRTLYNALHSEKKWDVRIRLAQQQLVKGLKGIVKKNKEAAILRALTAHNILFDSKQNVCLKLNLDITSHAPQPISTQQPQQRQQEQEPTIETNESKPTALPFSQPVNEGVRWYAPEVISNKPHVNSIHGAVFSLGLILWEMETGCVPYGEQDAVNASRQIVLGVTPKLELIQNKEMRELIERCLSLEPDDRPDLDTIEATLALIPAHQSINPKTIFLS